MISHRFDNRQRLSSTCDIQVGGISQLVPFREVLVPSRPGRSRTLVVTSSRAVSRPRVYTFLVSATALQWGVSFSYVCRIISARENTPSSQSAHFSVLVVPSRGLFSHLSISPSTSSLLSQHSLISRSISGIAANSLCVRTRSLLQNLHKVFRIERRAIVRTQVLRTTMAREMRFQFSHDFVCDIQVGLLLKRSISKKSE